MVIHSHEYLGQAMQSKATWDTYQCPHEGQPPPQQLSLDRVDRKTTVLIEDVSGYRLTIPA